MVEENCELLRQNIKSELEAIAAEDDESTDVERSWNVVKGGLWNAAWFDENDEQIMLTV